MVSVEFAWLRCPNGSESAFSIAAERGPVRHDGQTGDRQRSRAHHDRDEGRRQDGATSAEREELTRLRRENRQLRQERDILAKAAAWFARETAVIPSGSSHS
jgi:transposase-like protein